MRRRKRYIGKTLRLSETVLGKEHPDILMSMNNLANVLTKQ